MVEGMKKRIAAITPPLKRTTFQVFLEFYDKYIFDQYNWCTFHPDEIFDPQEWLDSAPYTMARKAELWKIYEDGNIDFIPNTDVKIFTKDESYPEYKYPRTIFSRSDEFKVQVGPFFKKLGDKVFGSNHFIKHVECHNKLKYFLQRINVPGKKYLSTDYSSYEASFTTELIKLRTNFYRFTLRFHPSIGWFEKRFKVLEGTNYLKHKCVNAKIKAKVMSGEMETSLGHCIVNDVVQTFVNCVMNNNDKDFFRDHHVIEGDDNAAAVDIVPTAEQYAELGFICKIDVQTEIRKTEFCGLIFDDSDRAILTNPLKVIMNFGYTNNRYACSTEKVHRDLLRCKSLSYWYQYPACPMVTALARYGMRVTHGMEFGRHLSHLDLYKRELFDQAMKYYKDFGLRNWHFTVDIGIGSRQLVAEKYGIPISVQLEFENLVNNKNDFEPIVFDQLLDYFHKDNIHYFHTFGYNLPESHDQVRMRSYHI
jgi:hypothetical protein